MAPRAVVVAVAQLPASLDADRAVAPVRPVEVFEVDVRVAVGEAERRHDRDVARAHARARVGHAELNPLFGHAPLGVARNDDEESHEAVVVVRRPQVARLVAEKE